MKTTDYVYCEDCGMYLDFYHYDYNIADAGHYKHDWRYVTEEELKECVQECKEDNCEGMY